MSRELNIVVDLSDWRAPKLSPWARRFLVAGALFALLAPEAGSQLEDVQLNTYFPAPSGIYQQLMTSGNAYFAVNGGAAEIGGITPPPGNTVSLAVAHGNVGIGVGAANTSAALHLGATGSPSGQSQIQLDASNGSIGQITALSAWNYFEFWADSKVNSGDMVTISAPTISYPGVGNDVVEVGPYGGAYPEQTNVGLYGGTNVSGGVFANNMLVQYPQPPVYRGNTLFNCYDLQINNSPSSETTVQCPAPIDPYAQVVAVAAGEYCDTTFQLCFPGTTWCYNGAFVDLMYGWSGLGTSAVNTYCGGIPNQNTAYVICCEY